MMTRARSITTTYHVPRIVAMPGRAYRFDTMSLYPGDRGAFADAPGPAQHGESRAMHKHDTPILESVNLDTPFSHERGA